MGKYYVQAGKTYFEFDSGERVFITPVSPALVIVLKKQNPEPMPPVNHITNEEGISFDEENFSDAVYQRKHAQWESEINNKWIDILISLGATPEKIDQIKFARVKSTMAALGVPLPSDESENFQYLKYCLMNDKAETQQLIDAVNQVSTPEERAINTALESFSDNISRPGWPESKPAEIGGNI